MIDDLTPTPITIPMVCPGCEGWRDPATYVAQFCAYHEPERGGLDDALVQDVRPTGYTEAGGEDNRRWCQLLHRRG
jgi:hypothetical protein